MGSPAAGPAISVVIVNHDYGRFLADSIGSIISQTHPAKEIIVADDGSTDESVDVIRSFGDQVVPVFGDHRGFCANVARGVARCTGDFVQLLDADDMAEPQLLERVAAELRRRPGLVQISVGRQCVDAENRVLRTRPVRFNEGDVTPLLLRYGRYVCATTSGLCFRRDVLQDLLPIERIHDVDTADTYLTVGAALAGPVGAVHEPLVRYRIHGANMQVGRSDTEFLVRQRLATVEHVRRSAAARGLTYRGPETDPEVVALEAVAGRPARSGVRLRALWETVRESLALRRQPVDAVLTVLARAVMLFLPSRGEEVIRHGPGELLRVHVLRRPPARGSSTGP